MLRYFTAGESHGPALTAIVDGFPAGVEIDTAALDGQLRRRQGGYGRGARQKIEVDAVEISAGVWQGKTIGSPIALHIRNRDDKLERLSELPRPRPGHGDLAGALKYGVSVRGVLERASARETAARVAVGALAQQLLRAVEIDVLGFVTQIGDFRYDRPLPPVDQWRQRRDRSAVYSLHPDLDGEAIARIDAAGEAGDTLGGVVETHAFGIPFGLGSHAQWDRKLDARLAAATMSVQAIKGVEIGAGFAAAALRGSQVHDPIRFDPRQQPARSLGYVRPTNHAGGIEAGMSNAQPIVVRAAMKPISTLRQPLESIDLATKQPDRASYERSDLCAVPAASVIVECVVAIELAAALCEKFGGDSLEEIRQRLAAFQHAAAQR